MKRSVTLTITSLLSIISLRLAFLSSTWEEGGPCPWQVWQYQLHVFLRLDEHRARGERDVVGCPGGARTVAPPVAPQIRNGVRIHQA